MTIDDVAREYAPEHDPPIGGYAILLAAHLGLVGAIADTLQYVRGWLVRKAGE